MQTIRDIPLTKVISFQAIHLETLELQDMQSYTQHLLVSGIAKTIEQNSEIAYSLIETGTKKTLAVAGVATTESIDNVVYRGTAWSLIGKDAGKHMITLHRAVSKALKSLTIPRIEAIVDKEFEEGIRWIEMLGFTCEGCMRKYIRERDHLLYARIN